MDYKKIYRDLIGKGKNRILEGYSEKHHIIPRCMGGNDDPKNLVSLTPEEHYVAHQLLVKIYPDNPSIVRAAQMMIPNRPSNKMYGWLKRKFSQVQSESQIGKNNTQYGTKWIHNIDLKISRKISKSDALPDGWQEGRIINFKSFEKRSEIKKQNKEKNDLKKIQRREQIIKDLRPLFDRYKNGETLQCVAEDYPNSYVSLYKKFQKYFPEVPRETGRGNKKGC
jgi:hypothetical protein